MSTGDRLASSALASPSRRRLCARLGLALLLAPLAPGLPALRRATAGSVDPTLAVALGRCFPHRASAQALGRAYRREHPGEADPDRLAELLRSALGPGAASAGPDALARRLGARIRRDFEAERMATVDGWILAETEARVFALLSLA
jgi:hypothetical protein